jgi:hypothetical protein
MLSCGTNIRFHITDGEQDLSLGGQCKRPSCGSNKRFHVIGRKQNSGPSHWADNISAPTAIVSRVFAKLPEPPPVHTQKRALH